MRKNVKQYYNALFQCIELNISEAFMHLDKYTLGEYEANVTSAHMCQSKEVDSILSIEPCHLGVRT